MLLSVLLQALHRRPVTAHEQMHLPRAVQRELAAGSAPATDGAAALERRERLECMHRSFFGREALDHEQDASWLLTRAREAAALEERAALGGTLLIGVVRVEREALVGHARRDAVPRPL